MSHRPLNSPTILSRYSPEGRAALEEGYGELVGDLVVIGAELWEIRDIERDIAEERYA